MQQNLAIFKHSIEKLGYHYIIILTKAFLAEATILETIVVKPNKVAKTKRDDPVSNFVNKRPLASRVNRTVDGRKDERQLTIFWTQKSSSVYNFNDILPKKKFDTKALKSEIP